MATYSASNPPIMEQTTQDTIENVQMVNLDLRRLFEARKNKLPLINPIVDAINQVTERAVKNQIAKAGEFYYENGSQ